MTPTINRPIIHDVGDTLVGLGPGSESRPQSEEIDVTVVIPMRNEEANVASLCAELQEVTDKELLRYEVIIVNDGSTDGTAAALEMATQNDPRFTVVEFYRGFGQSAALAAGFSMARGEESIVPMDGDLQNDPRDIPRLIAQLEKAPGYDIVSGSRKKSTGQTVHQAVSVAGRERSRQAPDLVQRSP